MGILFCCPNCERPLNIKAHLAGRKGKCPSCQCRIVVPESSQIAVSNFEQLVQTHEFAGANVSHLLETNSSSPELARGAVASGQAADLLPLDEAQLEQASIPSAKIGEDVDFHAEGPIPAVGPSQAISSPIESDPLHEAPNCKWYVRPPSGGQFGPADADLMEKWIDEGRVTGDSFVWREGWEDWKIAADIFTELSSVSAIIGAQMQRPIDIPDSVRARAAYLKARRRRTIWGIVGLVFGSILVITLLAVLFYVINQQNQG